MVHYLCYISTEQLAFKEDDLIKLLSVCRKNNRIHNITGLLLYFEGHFIQFIEGDKETVQSLFKKISRDNRHKSVFKITESKSKERKFGNWSMSFPTLNKDKVVGLPAYKPFEKEIVFRGFDVKDNHPGLVLMRSFMTQSKRKQVQYL
ncbi:blue light sensor protein [Leptobacterium flavescens]|uniref:Blue light sensor protein n=1 Tax=Leptobacterium flavescens TaxID=472055 RepID=A0A6P0UII2_9FLAO|nr:BLUF domain-containing protein [Leptobacterium flavescens]NER12260.1 blue light sensor protein [Leptobacterium flavescens]